MRKFNSNKIGIVLGSLGRGGAERVTTYLSEYFFKKGKEPYIITPIRRSDEYAVPEGVNRICLQDNGKNSYWGWILSLRKAIKDNEISIIIVMDTPTCVYAIPATLGLPITVIVSERNDPVHFSGKKSIKYLSRFLMTFADDFVFQTEDAKAFYSKRIRNKGIIIPNPINSKDLPEPWDGQRKKEIVSVGRLYKQKNHKMLIEAFSLIADKYPEYKLIIYGEGDQRNDLEALIALKHLEGRVLLPGARSNVLELIKDSCLFVFSSDFEGMPNALIEALALGLPCISTDCPCGGPASLIKNNLNGVLVPVGNEIEMSKAITYLLDNTQKSSELGRNAMTIRESLSMDSIGGKWLEFCNKVNEKKV